jgi:hypothetical protein
LDLGDLVIREGETDVVAPTARLGLHLDRDVVNQAVEPAEGRASRGMDERDGRYRRLVVKPACRRGTTTHADATATGRVGCFLMLGASPARTGRPRRA